MLRSNEPLTISIYLFLRQRFNSLIQAFSQDSEGGRPISGAAKALIFGRGGPQGEGKKVLRSLKIFNPNRYVLIWVLTDKLKFQCVKSYIYVIICSIGYNNLLLLATLLLYHTYWLLGIRAVARALIGGGGVYIHIFRFCPTSLF